MRILQTGAAGLLVLCLGSALASAFDFPELTGPVVDQADILTAASRGDIAAKSTALQEKSGIQLVVATVRSLEGSDIETYANQLFRTWQLGQSQKNNGVLLLVAPAAHKVRIEVGYGLEGTLTDALSSAIISGAIVPRFKGQRLFWWHRPGRGRHYQRAQWRHLRLAAAAATLHHRYRQAGRLEYGAADLGLPRRRHCASAFDHGHSVAFAGHRPRQAAGALCQTRRSHGLFAGSQFVAEFIKLGQ
jgi:TPM domain